MSIVKPNCFEKTKVRWGILKKLSCTNVDLERVRPLATNVWCYTKEAIISTKVDAEYECLLNHKCFCGATNRLFCIARVSGSLRIINDKLN